jgi:hypothetical protein
MADIHACDKNEENLGQEGRKPVGPARPPGLPAQPGMAEAKRLKQALAPKPAPEAVRKQMLDGLFDRLRNAGDQGTRSGSPHPSRASGSTRIRTPQIYSCNGQWFPCRRGNIRWRFRFSTGLSRWTPIGPKPGISARRHGFSPATWRARWPTLIESSNWNRAILACSPGMGMILQGAGLDKSALEIFKKALAIYPLAPDIQKLVEKLRLEVEGQDIYRVSPANYGGFG